jgi:hypothetical protein
LCPREHVYGDELLVGRMPGWRPMSDVYLHVGPVKTGSTYLQDLLWRNRDDLARQGYQHPGAHDNEMWLASNDVQDQAFVHFEMREAAGVWAKVCERVLGFDGPSVLSHEVLGMSAEDHIAKIVQSLQPARLHVVVMARSLAPMLPSLWQEKVKMVDPDISWPDFLAAERKTGSPVTDASLIVHRWLAHLPPAQIHVVTVPPRGADPGVLLDRFAEVLGIDTSRWGADGNAANRSLDRVQVELLRRLNLTTANALDRRAQRRLVQGALLPRLRPADPRRRMRLPESEREWIEGETSRRIDALRRSRATLHGDLVELECPADTWANAPLHVSEEDLLDEALQLLVSSHPDMTPDRLDII